MNHSFVQQIKKNFGRLNFRFRLFLSFFTIAFPIVLVVSFGSYFFMQKSTIEETKKSMVNTMERVGNQVSQVTEETENLSRNIIYNESVQSLLKEGLAGEKYPDTTDTAYFINSFIVNREYIESVVLTDLKDTLFSTEHAFTNVSSMDSIKKKWWYQKLSDTDSSYNWFQNSLVTESAGSKQDNDLMLTRTIRSLDDYKTPIGRMMIYIKKNYISQIFSDVNWGTTTNYWILDKKHQIMLENDARIRYSSLLSKIPLSQSEIKSQTSLIRMNNKEFIVGSKVISDDGWILVTAVPLYEVNSNGRILVQEITLVSLMILLIIALISFFTSRGIAKPIQSLSNTMDTYHGSIRNHEIMEVADYHNRTDEIGVIYRSYEKLVNRVETLIKEIYLKDLEKKDAELALLETQINPHFLYNTLDSINWMALANDQEEISEMVTALSDTFRLSLMKNNSSFTTVETEIQYVKSYLTIQKFRFGNRLNCQFDINPSILMCSMLRFILQPIVENALKHGIEKKENGGWIDITVTSEEEHLMIAIINDGSDIDLKLMEKHIAFDATSTAYLSFETEGYGIQNINRRIKIVHGQEYGIQYHILDQDRTECKIELPLIEQAPVS